MTEESKAPETENTPASDAPEAAEIETTDAAPDADEAGETDVAEAEVVEPEAADTATDDADGDPDTSDAGAEAAAEEPSAEAAAEEPSAEDTDDEATLAPDDAAGEEAPAEGSDDSQPEAAAEEPAREETHYDFETLHAMNVHQLREVAAPVDHDAVHGYSTMHKEDLVHALCVAFGVEEHVHHEVVGIDKVAIKAKLQALKGERDAAIEAGDKKQLKRVRRRIHNLKHRIRKATI